MPEQVEYIQLSFPVTGMAREILIAHLGEAGFEGFEETEEALLASIASSQYNEEVIVSIAAENSTTFSKTVIPQQNWNAIWESSFEPVIIPGFCIVRADFHSPSDNTPHEIIITPKMSFGTGHHATTRLMIGAMRDLDFKGRYVLDFGAGTGILAILAAKLGAGKVLAIDSDEWSVENARENLSANSAQNIDIRQGSLEVVPANEQFDVILANINRHILLQYMAQMRAMLLPGGVLLLSGILTGDEEIISQSAHAAGLKKVSRHIEGDWMALKFTA